ncbi:protein kinase domain-containing protein [Fumia xinanensis]|uniref:PASTA domain-containing protein n=1 Tax=Fumia xinanensis TaxID=2763659 RepID=A0A926E430_9FIRM|nr:PASTA domain-containing protein [Fumia xinanensis]MBC8558851.1 PASTA domain-containing protein [Fumia xinanensis]
MNENLCMGCMRDKGEEEVCPFCGYSDTSPRFPSYLAPRTVINNRYVVGKVLSYNGESVTYIGYDVIGERKVKVHEYFPDTLVTRGEDGKSVAVNNGRQIQFKAYMSDFIEIAEKLSRMRTLTCITQVFAICYQNNTVYSILEFVEGISLKTYLEKRDVMLTWTETSDLLLPLVKTLAIVHEEGLIHRGISTDSVILSRSKMVKLDGFAISAVRAARTELVAELFPGFSAPEQYSAVSPHGPWTDVYAVCALLYTCVTAAAPPEALIRSNSRPLLPPRERNETVPPRVSQAIIQGLSLSTTERIQNVEELLAKIGGPFQKGAVGSDAPTVSMRAQPPSRRPTSTLPRIPMEAERKQEEKEEKDGGNKRLILWSMGITLPILLVILIFTFWFLFGKDRHKEPEGDTTSIVDSMSENDPFRGESEFHSSSDRSESESSSSQSSEESSESSESKQMHKVANFVGQDYKTVTGNPENQKLYIFDPPEYVYDEQYPEGTITYQSVSEGTEFEKTMSIKFKVSKGSSTVLIPPYEKKTQAEYTAKLDELGIKYTILYRWDSSYPEGYVVGTDHMVGSKYNTQTGGTIEVYVNKAPPANSVD